jgi:hypothetical protein
MRRSFFIPLPGQGEGEGEGLSVAVEDGVATLTGIVDNWLEHRIAIESAYEAQARYVRDRLKITQGPAYYRP